MAGRTWKNTYRLSDDQIDQLNKAEFLMESMDLGKAEELLVSMLENDPHCIPVLSNLGHLYGRHLSEFEKAVDYYEQVLEIEPDNAWARDERRRYQRYLTFDED
jgi:tetratricopeptide (TPR) repeat protein